MTLQVPSQAAQSSVPVPEDFPFTSGSTAHIRRAVRSAAEPQQTLRAPVQHMPADALQMVSIMQQMDEMRAEISRLRQSQAGRAQTSETIGASETGSIMLPDYTSTDERSRFQGTGFPLVHLHRSTSFESVDNIDINSPLLPNYSSIASRSR